MELHTRVAYRLALAFALAATALGCGASESEVGDAVSAAQYQDNSCCPSGDDWFLSAPAPGDEFFDNNGDDTICVKFVGGGRGSSRTVPGFSIKDNNNPCYY